MSTCDLSAFPTHTYWQDHFPVGALSNLEPLGLSRLHRTAAFGALYPGCTAARSRA